VQQQSGQIVAASAVVFDRVTHWGVVPHVHVYQLFDDILLAPIRQSVGVGVCACVCSYLFQNDSEKGSI
jgi:hypothetical protein